MESINQDTSIDERAAVLADAQRRMALRFLRDQPDHTTSITDLVRYIDSYQGETAADQPASRERIEIELHHHHLPHLADADLVEYDLRNGRVQYHPDETTETLLQCVANADRR